MSALRRIRPFARRPSAAMLVALAGLFVALGGPGWAADTISGSRLTNRSVSAGKLKHNTLGTYEISESALGRVPRAANADRLGGLRARDYVKACQAGSIHGFARVDANASFPATFTEGLPRVFALHCGGGSVAARRVSAGVYRVRFSPTVGALAVGNGEADTNVSTRLVFEGSAPVFDVHVNTLGATSGPSDTAFTIVVP